MTKQCSITKKKPMSGNNVSKAINKEEDLFCLKTHIKLKENFCQICR